MNGESDKPVAVLIGIPDEDASVPPLQLLRSSGNAKETRQIPSARIFEQELNASYGMTFPRLV